VKKSRFFLLHPETNQGKITRLEDLHQEYVIYVRVCVNAMLDTRRYTLNLAEKQTFFPPAVTLTSQIEKNARDHAIQIVSSWAVGIYTRKIRPSITNLKKDGKLSDDDAKALYTIGSKIICQPWKFITQEHLDIYNALLDAHGGDKPSVRDTIPMRLSEMTARLEDAQETVTVPLWLRVSSLESRKSIWFPLTGNPYVQRSDDVSKGILARKTKGRYVHWRFEAVEKKEWEVPTPDPNAPRLGVDVGLNVLAATSDGTLYGGHVKPQFDRFYNRVKQVRANRQRQDFKENSPRLYRLESRLTGMVKTETGRIANQLIERHPGTVFVLEDLDLRGCRGQKRFAYRALQTNLSSKAPTEAVNPAYTSQECPSCGHISRGNRKGTKFTCKKCGRKAHADWVGACGILRRSEDKSITCADRPFDVKRKLEERHSLGSGRKPTADSPPPLGRRLTTGGSVVGSAPAQPQTQAT
jgi:putative transposase